MISFVRHTFQPRFFALRIFVAALLTHSTVAMTPRTNIGELLTPGWFISQNKRDHMEDYTIIQTPIDIEHTHAALLGICDGHGGSRAAGIAGTRLPELCAQQLPPLLASLGQRALYGLSQTTAATDDQPITLKSRLRALQAKREITATINRIFTTVEAEILSTPTQDSDMPSSDTDLGASDDDEHDPALDTSGSTAVTAYLWHADEQTNILITNLGDSRCVVASQDGTLKLATDDHKPDTAAEKNRILHAGGSITQRCIIEEQTVDRMQPIYRQLDITTTPDGSVHKSCKGTTRLHHTYYQALLNNREPNYLIPRHQLPATDGGEPQRVLLWPARVGGYAVSRAFGDPQVKAQGHPIIAEPDIYPPFSLDKDDFIIMASDGLWDMVSSQEAAQVVSRTLFRNGMLASDNPHRLCNEAAAHLGHMAMLRGSKDNISVLVALHRQPHQEFLPIIDPTDPPSEAQLIGEELFGTLDNNQQLQSNSVPPQDETAPPTDTQLIGQELFDTLLSL